jgi:hypothetical protein
VFKVCRFLYISTAFEVQIPYNAMRPRLPVKLCDINKLYFLLTLAWKNEPDYCSPVWPQKSAQRSAVLPLTYVMVKAHKWQPQNGGNVFIRRRLDEKFLNPNSRIGKDIAFHSREK